MHERIAKLIPLHQTLDRGPLDHDQTHPAVQPQEPLRPREPSITVWQPRKNR